MTLPSYFFVFDVESVGLHGEGFAVGWSVIQVKQDGHRLRWHESAHGYEACHHDVAQGNRSDRAWIVEHVVPHLEAVNTSATPEQVRQRFWKAWLHWKERGAQLAADVAWPVEARFLNTCIDDAPASRTWEGPYPLIDIASVRLAVGLDPLGTEERRGDELPAHNPLADARQSARLLVEALQKGVSL